jgi:hypothetical protein
MVCEASHGCRGLTLCLEKMIYLRPVFLSRGEFSAEIDVIHLLVCGVYHFCGSCVAIEVRTVQTSNMLQLLLWNQSLHTHFRYQVSTK